MTRVVIQEAAESRHRPGIAVDGDMDPPDDGSWPPYIVVNLFTGPESQLAVLLALPAGDSPVVYRLTRGVVFACVNCHKIIVHVETDKLRDAEEYQDREHEISDAHVARFGCPRRALITVADTLDREVVLIRNMADPDGDCQDLLSALGRDVTAGEVRRWPTL